MYLQQSTPVKTPSESVTTEKTIARQQQQHHLKKETVQQTDKQKNVSLQAKTDLQKSKDPLSTIKTSANLASDSRQITASTAELASALKSQDKNIAVTQLDTRLDSVSVFASKESAGATKLKQLEAGKSYQESMKIGLNGQVKVEKFIAPVPITEIKAPVMPAQHLHFLTDATDKALSSLKQTHTHLKKEDAVPPSGLNPEKSPARQHDFDYGIAV